MLRRRAAGRSTRGSRGPQGSSVTPGHAWEAGGWGGRSGPPSRHSGEGAASVGVLRNSGEGRAAAGAALRAASLRAAWRSGGRRAPSPGRSRPRGPPRAPLRVPPPPDRQAAPGGRATPGRSDFHPPLPGRTRRQKLLNPGFITSLSPRVDKVGGTQSPGSQLHKLPEDPYPD